VNGWRDRVALAEARFVKRPVMWALRDPRLLRPVFAAALWARRGRVPVAVGETVLGGVPVRVLTPPGAEAGAVLYLHGGGFVIGGPVAYHGLAGRIALASRQRVYLPDYRLAPEAPFPAAPEDALATWEALADRESGPLGVAGDSAGGNLALGLLHSSGKRPDRMALLSPIADMRPGARDALRAGPPDQLLPRAWAEQRYDIVYWSERPRGGHFAPFERPAAGSAARARMAGPNLRRKSACATSQAS